MNLYTKELIRENWFLLFFHFCLEFLLFQSESQSAKYLVCFLASPFFYVLKKKNIFFSGVRFIIFLTLLFSRTFERSFFSFFLFVLLFLISNKSWILIGIKTSRHSDFSVLRFPRNLLCARLLERNLRTNKRDSNPVFLYFLKWFLQKRNINWFLFTL